MSPGWAEPSAMLAVKLRSDAREAASALGEPAMATPASTRAAARNREARRTLELPAPALPTPGVDRCTPGCHGATSVRRQSGTRRRVDRVDRRGDGAGCVAQGSRRGAGEERDR